jgi:hypothetical protein
MACASGNSFACMASIGGMGTVSPDNTTPPCIKNQ